MVASKLTKDLDRKVQVLALLGDASRIQIINLLVKQEKMSVTDIAGAIGGSIACTSHHLQLLKEAKLVVAEREGNTIFYKIVPDPFLKKIQEFIY